MPLLYPPSTLDFEQIIQHAFDEAQQRLRVDTEAVITAGGQFYVAIDHTEDSIRLGDGVNLLTSTTVGSDIGLDVFLLNPSIPVTVNGINTPTIQNTVTGAANTESSYVLPANSKTFSLKSRGNSILKVAYTAGQSGSNYITLYAGTEYVVDNLDSAALTIYFQASKPNEIVEIISWA